MFYFAKEAVGSERAARIGVAPNTLVHGLVAGDFLERGAPLAGRNLGAPGGQVEKRGARIGSRTVQCGGIGVERRARPGIFPCVLCHPGACGVEFDVAQGPVCMGLVHGARVESVLPEVAGPAVDAVDVLRVQEVRSPNGFGQRVLARRHADQVNVVRHQTVAFDPKTKPRPLFAKELRVLYTLQ